MTRDINSPISKKNRSGKAEKQAIVNEFINKVDDIGGRIIKIGNRVIGVTGFAGLNYKEDEEDFENPYNVALSFITCLDKEDQREIFKSQENFLDYIVGMTLTPKKHVVRNITELGLPKWKDLKQKFDKQTDIAAKETNKKLEIRAIDAVLEQDTDFVSKYNGPGIAQLKHINKHSNFSKMDNITGDAVIEQGQLKISIENYSNFNGLKTSALKLLDICTISLTNQNKYKGDIEKINPTVVISLEQYMELCGIPNTKSSKDNARRKVQKDLQALYQISLEWSEKTNGKTKAFDKMRICDRVKFSNGNITLNFSKDMSKYLTQAYIMQYPLALLKLDERNNNAYNIGRKLAFHNSIVNNRRRGTANIISVKSLLQTCPDIPSYEEVMKTGRQLDQRIRTPFEKALDALPLIKWEYCNSKGTPLTETQLDATDYLTFEKQYIKFEINGTSNLDKRCKAIKNNS